MVGWLSGRLRCFGGKHQRSEKHLKSATSEGGYVSQCRYCGVPMKRRSKRDWVTISRREFDRLKSS